MSSFRAAIARRGTVLAAPLIIAACDFQPVYAPEGTGAALVGNVDVRAADDSIEFELVRALEKSFGPTSTATYELSTDVDTRSERVSITATQSTNRYNLVGEVDWVLTEAATGREVAKGSADGFSSYSATGTTVATLAAQRDGYRRLMAILSDKIVTDLTTRAPEALSAEAQ